MHTRTAVSILLFTLITSFVIALHSGLVNELVEREICISKHSWASCNTRRKIKNSNVVTSEKHQVGYWQKVIKYSTYFPSIISFLALAGVIDWLIRKESFGLYITIVLACQSLIYMTIVIAHNSRVWHLLFGSLLTILHGSLPGATMFSLVFAVGITDQDSTRTLLFIYIESMTYIGTSVGNWISYELPNYMELSYVFLVSFTISVFGFLVVYLGLPAHQVLLRTKRMTRNKKDDDKEQKCKLTNENENKQIAFKHPFQIIRNEYIAGIILTVGLTELGRRGYNAVINTFITIPPISMDQESGLVFIFISGAVQGWVSIFLGIFLIKLLYASDSMLSMIALSSAAFWFALTGFAGSKIILYTLSCSLGVFLPLAMASLKAAATKGPDICSRNVIMVLALIGLVSMLCRAVTTYNHMKFDLVTRKISRQLFLLLCSILQLMAFIVLGSISLAFKKPIVELREKTSEETEDQKRPLMDDKEEHETDDDVCEFEMPTCDKRSSFL